MTALFWLLSGAFAADPAPVRDIVVAQEAPVRACGDPGGDLSISVRYEEGGAAPTIEVRAGADGAVPPEVVACLKEVLQAAPWPPGADDTVLVTLRAGPEPFSERALLMGSLPKSDIAVVKARMKPIAYCYQRTLGKGPPKKQPHGNVAVRFMIGADGAVMERELAREDWTVPPPEAAGFEQCLLLQFDKMTFPPPRGGGVVIVTYPFVFSPS